MVKLIILGAGEGKRLRPLTKDIPKCMVKIFDKSLLEHQLDVLKKCGISDIVIVTGYCRDKIKVPNVKYYENKFFDSTNMVETLFCAEKEIEGKVIVSYGDIIYERDVLNKLLSSKSDFSIVVDKNWKPYWESRFTNILDDAESLTIENGLITSIGQKVNSVSQIQGQYIGLMKFQNNATNILKNFYHSAKMKSKNFPNPLNPNVSYENSYMTDLLQGLINQGHRLIPVEINNGWLELDTLEDLKIYQKMYKTKTLNKFINLENL